MASTVIIGLAFVTLVADPLRTPTFSRLMRSIWTGAPGRWLFRAAAWRFKATGPGGVGGTSSATGKAATGPLTVYAGLDSALQKKLPSLRGTVERLVERQAAAERRIAELGASLSMTGQTLVGQGVLADERAALAAEIEGARRQAMEERTRAIEGGERIRLLLVRLRSGLGTAEQVEAELGRLA